MVTSMLSMSAIFLLPRQFHTTIIENRKENFLKTAIWVFPLYLLLFNFCISDSGEANIIFRTKCKSRALSYSRSAKIWKRFNSVIFLGGLSASISMIISSITLSIMLSNNVIIPYGWIDTFKTKKRHFQQQKHCKY
jgi:Na+/proline symporter